MKCISLWQPWASLLVHGLKRCETRSWPLRHRGPLLIHAAKTWSRDLANLSRAEPFRTALRGLGVLWSDKDKPNLPFGAIVGRVEVVDCYPTERIAVAAESLHDPDPQVYRKADALHIGEREWAFGDYSDGRYAWLCANFVAFAEPVPCRGAQGLFDVPDELVPGAA